MTELKFYPRDDYYERIAVKLGLTPEMVKESEATLNVKFNTCLNPSQLMQILDAINKSEDGSAEQVLEILKSKTIS